MSARPEATGGAPPVLVGFDGSAESRDALALARTIAALTGGARIVVLSVITSEPLAVEAHAYVADLREQAEALREQARAVLDDAVGVEVLALPGAGAPRELTRAAEERGAAFVVLGSTHRGPLGRVFPGTVADRLLAGGSCPVAVAPRGFAERDARIETIGVGYDRTPESRRALAQAAALADAAGARVEVIAAVDQALQAELAAAAQGYAALASSPGVTRQQVDATWNAASAAVHELIPNGVSATIDVLEGDPAAALVERSEELDLLVLGSRGYGPLGRALVGSVSAAVLRAATCPVIVVTRPPEAA